MPNLHIPDIVIIYKLLANYEPKKDKI